MTFRYQKCQKLMHSPEWTSSKCSGFLLFYYEHNPIVQQQYNIFDHQIIEYIVLLLDYWVTFIIKTLHTSTIYSTIDSLSCYYSLYFLYILLTLLLQQWVLVSHTDIVCSSLLVHGVVFFFRGSADWTHLLIDTPNLFDILSIKEVDVIKRAWIFQRTVIQRRCTDRIYSQPSDNWATQLTRLLCHSKVRSQPPVAIFRTFNVLS